MYSVDQLTHFILQYRLLKCSENYGRKSSSIIRNTEMILLRIHSINIFSNVYIKINFYNSHIIEHL